MITAMMTGVLAAGSAACAQNAQKAEPVPGKDGNKYVPYEERTGNESIVYFTRDLSPEGLRKAYEAVCGDIVGRVAVKLHTGEQNGPNIIPSSWVKELIEKDIPDATIVETIPTTQATATPLSSTARRWKSMDGLSVPWTSWTRRTP